jgi:hypothetical protein
MIEITLGACPAGFGTVPSFSIMGRMHQLFPYQFECPTESSGSCTCIYIYIHGDYSVIDDRIIFCTYSVLLTIHVYTALYDRIVLLVCKF